MGMAHTPNPGIWDAEVPERVSVHGQRVLQDEALTPQTKGWGVAQWEGACPVGAKALGILSTADKINKSQWGLSL